MSILDTVECVNPGAPAVYLSHRMMRRWRGGNTPNVCKSRTPMRFTLRLMTHARLGPAIPILDVRHIEEALSFYVDRLGFDIDFRYEKEPENYAGVRRGDVRLHMHRQGEEHFHNGAAGRVRFRVPVDDPDALYSEFKAMGVLDDDIEVHETEWGTREFGFRDPDGNTLVFFRIT